MAMLLTESDVLRAAGDSEYSSPRRHLAVREDEAAPVVALRGDVKIHAIRDGDGYGYRGYAVHDAWTGWVFGTPECPVYDFAACENAMLKRAGVVR